MTVQAAPLYIGDIWPIIINATNSDGSAMNLTALSYTPAGQYWQNTSTSATSLTVGSGITIISATTGQFQVTIPQSVTSTIGLMNVRIQIWVTDSSSNRYTLGLIIINAINPEFS